MLAYGVADSAQLAVLTKALNDYCAKHHIICKQERERIAAKVMSLSGEVSTILANWRQNLSR